MSGIWSETKKQTVELPEEDPDPFHLYVDLLYAGRLAVVAASPPEHKHWNIESTTLAKVYVLAEKLQDSDAKNKALAAILVGSVEKRSDGIEYFPGLDAIKIICEGTPADAKARKLIVDLYTARSNDTCIGNEELPGEFIRELLLNVLKKRPQTPVVVDTTDITPYMEDVYAQGFW